MFILLIHLLAIILQLLAFTIVFNLKWVKDYLGIYFVPLFVCHDASVTSQITDK